jgi:hypothetical protein
MALPLSNNAEGGSDETTVTTGNSGGASGDAWDVVDLGGTSPQLVFDSAHPAHGAMGYRFTQGNPEGVLTLRWSTSPGSFTEIWGRVYLYRDAAPAVGTQQLIRINNSAQTRQAWVGLGVTGNPRLFVADSASIAEQSTVTVASGQLVRIEFHFISSDTGLIEAKLFNSADSTSPSDTVTRVGDTDTGTGAAQVAFGHGVADNVGYTVWLDDMQVNSTGWPGPAISASAADNPPLGMRGRGAGW